jgi:hypothetical protein
MKHDPIHPAAPAMATFLHQLMDSRIDHLHRKRAGKISQRAHKRATNLRYGTVGARHLDPEALLRHSVRPPKHDQSFLPMPDQPLRASGTKRPPATEHEQRFEQ